MVNEIELPVGTKYSLVALSRASSRLKQSVDLPLDATAHSSLPFQPNYTIWEKWLGTIQAEELREANLVLMVRKYKARQPHVIDAQSHRLDVKLTRLFYSLLTVGVPKYETAIAISGSWLKKGPDVRSVSRFPIHLPIVMQRMYIQEGNLAVVGKVFSKLIRLGKATRDYTRVRAGLSAYLLGLRIGDNYGNRFHQMVRAIEALLLMPERAGGEDTLRPRHRTL